MLEPNFCFICAHLNTANHFSLYSKALEEEGFPCAVISSPAFASKFSEISSPVEVIDFSNVSDEEMFKTVESCLSDASTVICDVGSQRWERLYGQLKDNMPNVLRLAYYDNPEKYVPGGYSTVVSKVAKQSQGILFANKNFIHEPIDAAPGEQMDLSGKKLLATGYYPMKDALAIKQMRADKVEIAEAKKEFLARHSVNLNNPKIYAYMGGANVDYYNVAFPKFLGLLKELYENEPTLLDNAVFVLQQHPRAKNEGNIDAKALESFPEALKERFIVSDISTNNMCALSDGVFYHQTSMAAQFVLAGIPLIAQVAHETYPDLLIQNGFPSVTKTEEFAKLFQAREGSSMNDAKLKERLGVDDNWKENLIGALCG